jgi:hypothetical protein
MSKIKFNNFEFSDDGSEMKQIILNDGLLPGGDPTDSSNRMRIHDVIHSNDLSALFSHTVTEIMVEATEPILTITPLLDQVQAEGRGTHEWRMPAIGTFSVERVTEGESYPTRSINMGGAVVTAGLDKYGIALAFTAEAIEASRWDIVSLCVREAGRAFGRNREMRAVDHLRGLGDVVFDNLNPAASRRGPTTGRNRSMSGNGTLSAEDIFEAYHDLLARGYQPDLMIMSPQTYMMFIKDPILRAFAMQAGGGVVFGNYSGNAVNRFARPGGTQSTIGSGSKNGSLVKPLNGAAATSGDFNPSLTSAPVLPSYLPFPLRIVVSPFMHYDPATRLTDIVLADSSALGAFIMKSSLRQVNWSDPEVDIQKMRFDESWGLMMYEEGMGVSVLKNIKVDQNWYNFMTPQPTFNPTDLSDISLSVPPPGLLT